MNEQPNMITIYTTSDEVAALKAAADVYLDILEVVEPLEPDRTRRESIHQLEVFKNRCQDANARPLALHQ